MPKACYRKLRKYKYQLVKDYQLPIPIKGQSITEKFIHLDSEGNLLIKQHYAWDGPSGPTVDTLNFMRGSLVHDALYQLLRLGRLKPSHREQADQLLHDLCVKDGMSRFRAFYVHRAVRLFAGGAAIPGTQKPDPITCVPEEG